ncbi:hypothetical protein MMC29_003833 [Sticta canariensis]|nr:hypothetical protein [Sticta canariensis]
MDMDPSSSTDIRTCNACKKLESTLPAGLKRCAKCQTTLYCSRDYQKADWKSHKKDCSRSQGARSSPSSSEALNPDSQRMENMFRLFASGVATSDNSDLFTTPNNPGYLERLPEAKAFTAIIDSYRLRKDDEYKFTGDTSGLYNQEHPLPDFRRFLNQVEACGDVFPSWWSQEKRRACESLALSDSWSNINNAAEKSDIMEHYGDRLMPMRLRMLAERATGKHLGL